MAAPEARIIKLDGRAWQTKADFYDALAEALGSVEWHGRNADAFMETMVYYLELNRVQPPYEVRASHPTSELKFFLQEFASWLAEARRDRVEDSDWGDDIEVSMVVE
jgi:hypothetical protein